MLLVMGLPCICVQNLLRLGSEVAQTVECEFGGIEDGGWCSSSMNVKAATMLKTEVVTVALSPHRVCIILHLASSWLSLVEISQFSAI